MPERVVITGLGVVSCLGTHPGRFWDNIIQGNCGISTISLFDTSRLMRHNAGEVKNFRLADFMDCDQDLDLPRSHALALAAAYLALKDARLQECNLKEAGAVFGSLGVGMEFIEGQVKSFEQYPARMLIDSVMRILGLGGFSTMLSCACASGSYALALAYERIRRGQERIILSAGVDHLAITTYIGFHRLFSIAPDKCRPFDKNRQGLIPSEGAAVLVVESLSSANKRKAPIYAEIIGYGQSCDAYHPIAPSKDGYISCIRDALKHARISPIDVDYINAHGTGTIQNDTVECGAIKRIFGERSKRVPVSSLKSMLGHSMGAASAIEAAACCLALKEQLIPPTINYETPDPQCQIDCVPNKSREARLNIILKNAFGFGGINSSLIFKRWE